MKTIMMNTIASAGWTALKTCIPAAVFLAACAGPDATSLNATAPEAGGATDYAYSEILRGDWGAAETSLRTANQDDPLILLNLAFVMAKQGNDTAAEDIYKQILNGSQDPYATMDGGKPRRVKNVALQALLSMREDQ